MRNLTIRREKTFVACLAKMKVYIEDPTSSEIVINDVPCRKLGELKNGEEKTFAIGNGEAKIFVIAGKMSKDFCNDLYSIPAGENDVFLVGKNLYNPANGNAFRFDGIASEEVQQNRKKGTRKGIVVLCIACVVGVAIGLGLSLSILALSIFGSLSYGTPEPKTFTSGGMQITLTDDFIETEMDGFEACYGTEDVAVIATKESFSAYEGLEDQTLEEYGKLVLEANEMDPSVKLQEYDGLVGFEYQATNPDTNDEISYLAFVFKGSDAFWLIQFGLPEGDIESYRSTFVEWAKTVEFSDR